MIPSVTPSFPSHASRIAASRMRAASASITGVERSAGSGYRACWVCRKRAPSAVQSWAGAPATMPSKSSA